MSRTKLVKTFYWKPVCHWSPQRKWRSCNGSLYFHGTQWYPHHDLHKTVAKVDEELLEALKQIAKSGKKVLFVATKKQAKQVLLTKLLL